MADGRRCARAREDAGRRRRLIRRRLMSPLLLERRATAKDSARLDGRLRLARCTRTAAIFLERGRRSLAGLPRSCGESRLLVRVLSLTIGGRRRVGRLTLRRGTVDPSGQFAWARGTLQELWESVGGKRECMCTLRILCVGVLCDFISTFTLAHSAGTRTRGYRVSDTRWTDRAAGRGKTCFCFLRTASRYLRYMYAPTAPTPRQTSSSQPVFTLFRADQQSSSKRSPKRSAKVRSCTHCARAPQPVQAVCSARRLAPQRARLSSRRARARDAQHTHARAPLPVARLTRRLWLGSDGSDDRLRVPRPLRLGWRGLARAARARQEVGAAQGQGPPCALHHRGFAVSRDGR